MELQMLVKCPRCGEEVEKTVERVRSHVRYKHGKLTDSAKIRLRDSMVPFVDTSGFKTRSRTQEENHLTRSLGIK